MQRAGATTATDSRPHRDCCPSKAKEEPAFCAAVSVWIACSVAGDGGQTRGCCFQQGSHK
eukprot:228038-Amphidinium_carterae.1